MYRVKLFISESSYSCYWFSEFEDAAGFVRNALSADNVFSCSVEIDVSKIKSREDGRD